MTTIQKHGIQDRVVLGSTAGEATSNEIRDAAINASAAGANILTLAGHQEFQVLMASSVAAGAAPTSGGEWVSETIGALALPFTSLPPDEILFAAPVNYNAFVLTKDAVDVAQKAGYQVMPWTVNSYNEMHSILDMGVNGVITDNPVLWIASTPLVLRFLLVVKFFCETCLNPDE